MRQVVLDTETTGLNPNFDKIIEVAAVEIIDRKIGGSFQSYCRPTVQVDSHAYDVHGIDDAFLADKPRFSEIEQPLLEFLTDADEILIHNAPFDVRFLNNELSPPYGRRMGESEGGIDKLWKVVDTLVMARQKRPGARSSLDALSKHYDVEGRQGAAHGALLDVTILARVYLAMTAGQHTMALPQAGPIAIAPLVSASKIQRTVFLANAEELAAHAEFCRSLKIPVF